MRRRPLLLAAFAATLGCGASALVQAAPSGLSSDDRLFLQQGAESDLAELEAARLALAKAQDSGLRQFARRETADHRQVRQRMQRLAGRKGVRLPGDVSALQGARLKLLQAADGAQFDERYADEFGARAHHGALTLYQEELKLGRDPDVVAFAREVLPALKDHLRQLERLQASESDSEQGTSMGAAPERKR